MLGAQSQIDNYLSMRGLQRHMVGGYRVTDENAMLAAMEAAGTARMLVEAQLSKVRCMPQSSRYNIPDYCQSREMPMSAFVTTFHDTDSTQVPLEPLPLSMCAN